MADHNKSGLPASDQWRALARNDWAEILVLLEKKTFRRKFQIIEAFSNLASVRGFHRVSHADIARVCGITRPVVSHHFPTEEHLISLTYRYTYARLQKYCADAVTSKSGTINQIKGYIDAIARWTYEHQSDARFLSQFFALMQTSPEYLALYERNLRIGRERISALCLAAQAEGSLSELSQTEVAARAASMQLQLFGFIVIHSARQGTSLTQDDRKELIRSCLQVLGYSRQRP